MATATKNGKVSTEELPEFDPTFGYDVDQSTVEEPQSFGPSFPIVQWHYGDPKMVKAGGMDWQGGWFFGVESNGKKQQVESEEQKAKRAEIGAAMEAVGWEATTWIHDDGSSTEGFWKREIAVSAIALRKCWEVWENKKRYPFAWNDYKSAEDFASPRKPSSRLQVLVLVKGLEDVGPLTLTLKGSGAMAFEGTYKMNGALSQFGRTVIKAANEATAAAAKKAGREPTKWAARCFWLPVGADRLPDGKPKFTEVGKDDSTSNVVLPVALGLPESYEDVDLRRFYVGKELQDKTQELYVENEEWRLAWNEMDTDTDSAPGAHTNGTGPKKKEEVTVSDDQLAEMGL